HTLAADSTTHHTRRHKAPAHTAPAAHTHPRTSNRVVHCCRSHTATPAKTLERSASCPPSLVPLNGTSATSPAESPSAVRASAAPRQFQQPRLRLLRSLHHGPSPQ